ncbi:DUF4388 domain-containing protein [Corallococcus sp. M34]|uniref:DUF4388 domain-containing protein n=1 Tax=Citreicoccus inhibens TaxID=2849499 RepID=UPI001C21E80D|nr:DUF4388 domain-containing protein [Citreicoccus inhibens]MBU8897579.1 DUF4388 domain-containing protein [Citreicoccus inhibens]
MAARPKALPKVSGESASLELERPLAAAVSGERPLAAHFLAPEGLVLLQDSPAVAGFFAGSLGTLSVEEAFAHVLSGIRTGQLVVQHGAVRRSVSFRDGQVVFATSTEPWERLGTVLTRLGLVSEARLREALTRVTSSRRLGQVLTSSGWVTEANLYSAMTYVVREVVLNLFEMMEGSFLFVETRVPVADAVKLPERTRDLVLAGIKRAEETVRLRRNLPDELWVVPGSEGPLPGDEALFAKLGAGASLGAMRAAYPGSQYSFYTWFQEGLRGRNLLTRAPEPVTSAGPEVEGMAWELLSAEERYNLLLSLVHRALRDAGNPVDLLRGFLDAPPPGLESAYAGVALGPDGRVDVARLRANVSSGGEAVGRALALEALDALVAYALFSARNVLPAEVAERLANTYRTLQGSPT